MSEKRNGQFIITDSAQKYKNPWIEVIEDQVIRPDGKPGIFGVVRMIGGVSVLPLDEDGYVYMTEEFHYAIGMEDIETASGGKDGDEKPVDAAKRELKEELGIEAREWVDLGLVNPFTTVIVSPQRIFLAKKLSFGKDDQEVTENIKLVKVKLEEAVKMVMDSVITHGPSCVLILKANEYLK
ncbi:MAG: NUDIX hydrolase [Candidatus Moraniibacteriota bacterium]